MSDMLSSIGSFLTSDSKPINSLLGLAGAGTNIYSGIQNIQNQNRLQSAQNYVTSLTTNPTKMAQATAAYTQPLTAGLTSDVSNLVQGNLAERGLGSSPAAYTSALTQAISPYVQQNQSTALNALMQSLGLASGQRSIQSPTQDISKLLAQLRMPAGSTSTNPYQVLYNAQQPDQTLNPTDPSLSDSSLFSQAA